MLRNLMNSSLIFPPNEKKTELWRLVTYSLLHRSYLHLIPNIILQLLCGIPLEVAHAPTDVMKIYFFGILTGKFYLNRICLTNGPLTNTFFGRN